MYLVNEFVLAVGLTLISQLGCAEVAKVTRPTLHQRFDWQAEDFFDDSQVIALCKAIEANDLEEMERLIEAGADVNANGKGNMTPLLWAYPDNKPERFKKLLEHGADPNVIFKSDFNTRMLGIVPGDSITHMVCGTWFPKYFDHVFAHGGDPNLWHPKEHETPIFELIEGPAKEKPRKLRRLIELGANLDANRDYAYAGGWTPAMVAAGTFGQYDLALILVQAGADYTAYLTNSNQKLIHILARVQPRVPRMSPQQQTDYRNLVEWLEAHGESLELARADIERWKKWAGEGKTELIKKEVAERKAREARERDAAREKQAVDE